MLAAKIYKEEWDIDQRLLEFGVTRAELIIVVQATLAERMSTVEIDVLNAAGSLAYIHGSRHLRFLTLAKGYKVDRNKNVESSRHPDKDLKIAYQNVDLAATAYSSPKSISGKRSASAEAIENAQGRLFSLDQLPEVVAPEDLKKIQSAMWYLCVSFSGDTVRAELSLPIGVKNGNFCGFLERIFIIEDDGWAMNPISDSGDEGRVDLTPLVVRK